MIVLDEQLLGRGLERDIAQWYRGTVQFITEAAFLGMSDDKYALWVEKPSSLSLILQAHAEGMRLEKMSPQDKHTVIVINDHASSTSSTLASCRSAVSNPLGNRSYTGTSDVLL